MDTLLGTHSVRGEIPQWDHDASESEQGVAKEHNPALVFH
jgi:hypothetical protein